MIYATLLIIVATVWIGSALFVVLLCAGAAVREGEDAHRSGLPEVARVTLTDETPAGSRRPTRFDGQAVRARGARGRAERFAAGS